MAITRTNINTNKAHLGYNNLTYYFISDNIAKDGFRYVADIKDMNNNLLFTKNIIPSFIDNKCILQLNSELTDFISYNYDESKFDLANFKAENSYLEFKIEMGEEYYYNWRWREYGYAYTDSNWWPNRNNPVFNPGLTNKTFIYNTNISDIPNYTIGDDIYISLDLPNSVTLPLAGTKRIVDIVEVDDTISGLGYVAWAIILDYTWIGSGTTIGGNTRYDDNRKTKFSNLLTVEDELIFNGIMNKSDWLNYDENDYLMKTGGKDIHFLTNLPQTNYVCRKDDILILNYLTHNLTTEEMPGRIYFESDDGTKSYIPLTKNTTWDINSIDVSPKRTNWGTKVSSSGTSLPIIKDNTKKYKFYIANDLGTVISKIYTIDLDKSCNSIDALKLIYLDKMGSFLSFNFNARNFENKNIKRETYKKYLGGMGTNGYTYEMTDGGTNIYHQSTETSFELNTGYLTPTMSEHFPIVLESPITYIVLNDELIRCNLTTTSIQVKKTGWYEQKQYKVRVTLANDEGINI